MLAHTHEESEVEPYLERVEHRPIDILHRAELLLHAFQ